ncbi:MAG: HD domain-containing protein [Clostridia bacterium]|nr:HD domain-containing protein [Clostridia bacterium]
MGMNGVKIADLKDGMICDGTYILKEALMKKTAAGKFYIDLVFLDDTGEAAAKKWDAVNEDMDRLVPNRLYIVNTRVATWQNKLQLNINSIRPASAEEQSRISEYIPAAPLSPGEMMETVNGYIVRIGNKDMRKLVESLYADYSEKLMYYPAAKALHHAVRSGYLYHISTMLKTAEKLSEVYESLDMDLLYTGVLLHDIMKMEELDSTELGIADYSIQGQLIGHIEMGVSIVDQKRIELGLDDKVCLLVKHMILSHHSLPEYGSPKPPMFLEAELLHYIDLIDARVYDFEQQYRTVMPGEITEKVWSLDRRIYRPDY